MTNSEEFVFIGACLKLKKELFEERVIEYEPKVPPTFYMNDSIHGVIQCIRSSDIKFGSCTSPAKELLAILDKNYIFEDWLWFCYKPIINGDYRREHWMRYVSYKERSCLERDKAQDLPGTVHQFDMG